MKKKIAIILLVIALFGITFGITLYVKQLQVIKSIKDSYNKYEHLVLITSSVFLKKSF